MSARWNQQEKLLHINVLEMLAILYSLRSLFDDTSNTHFMVLCDNTTAVAYLNKGGGTWSDNCNVVSRLIWDWCQKRSNWITVGHIPGVQNIDADFASRNFTDDTEWGLNKLIFKAICLHWFKPEVDLFASANNHLLDKYVSWGPDPHAIAYNAFLLNWNSFQSIFVFPPFRLTLRCVQKIRLEKPKGILVTPYWPGQAWYSSLQTIALGDPLLFAKKEGNLIPKNHQSASRLGSTPLVAIRF